MCRCMTYTVYCVLAIDIVKKSVACRFKSEVIIIGSQIQHQCFGFTLYLIC